MAETRARRSSSESTSAHRPEFFEAREHDGQRRRDSTAPHCGGSHLSDLEIHVPQSCNQAIPADLAGGHAEHLAGSSPCGGVESLLQPASIAASAVSPSKARVSIAASANTSSRAQRRIGTTTDSKFEQPEELQEAQASGRVGFGESLDPVLDQDRVGLHRLSHTTYEILAIRCVGSFERTK